MLLGTPQVAQVSDVQNVEMTVGKDDTPARRLELVHASRQRLSGQDFSHCSSSRGRRSQTMADFSSSRDSVAVPCFMTTMPPA